MNRLLLSIKKHCCPTIVATMLFASCGTQPDNVTEKIYSFPNDGSGIEKGVSAAYAGKIGNYIIFMGGCNFPNTPASEGGEKIFYDAIYSAPIPQDEDTIMNWSKIGTIDEPSAYGVSISMLDGIVCVGGTNGKKPLKTAYLITLFRDSMELTINPLPDLPVAIDNMGGAATDTMIYVVGGNANGVPSNRVFMLDFTNLQQEWIELPPYPGSPRVQPVCSVMRNPKGELSLYVWGGFAQSVAGEEPTLSKGGCEYSFKRGTWSELPPPQVGEDEIFLGGAAVASVNDTMAVFTGGVNPDIFISALKREAILKNPETGKDENLREQLINEGKEYMSKSSEWYKFNEKVLLYNSLRNIWQEIVVTKSVARAGASLLYNDGQVISIGGELKPGIRVPQVAIVNLK